MTNEQRFALIQKYIERMPSLSTTVTKVLEVCNRPSTSANDLNRVIALDPVLTGQVLKLINSAYYSLPNQISSLTRAIIMLGINTVKNLALSTAVLGSMGRQDSFRSLSMDAFWTHSLCVGVLAKALAGLKGIPGMMQEEFFVAGLLHDLGKIPLNNCFAEEYRQALELSTIEQGSLPKAEEILLGFDHGQAGKMIADKWQLSQALTELLRFHHTPENASPNNRQLVSVVALANTYANLFDVGSAGDRFPDMSRVDELLLQVGLRWHDLSSLHTVVEQEIEKAQVFLQIAREAA
ncbi:MAG: HDOD domain-containing protein [Proteobacteria bacterium]|nr:HDOD domain-containing protein [Pseudomonadota bacterium]MBU1547697.1 HDOD domain-containing protein [Pseudomonadota bacterium]MBU2619682.1 HDOD domain-containing protein [Pseudomonadota bacterium]